MTSERDRLVEAVRTVPYSLRLVALVLIFNGVFALIKLTTTLIGNDVELDWRIVNIIIGYGLLMKQRIFSITAFVSVAASAFLHVKSLAAVLSDYPIFGASGTLYFGLALALDLGMLYVILYYSILKNLFNMKGKL